MVSATAAETSSALSLPRPRGLGWAASLAEQASGLSRLEQLYRQRPEALDAAAFIRYALGSLLLGHEVCTGSAEAIPASGPLIVVANHPGGAADGLLLADLLLRRRPELRILANQLLQRVPEIAPLILPVDVFRPGASSGGLRAAVRHLDAGGALLLFPAGEVSRLDLRRRRIADPPWAESVSLLVRRTRATVLPMHIEGRAAWPSLLAGVLHPLLRTACLPRDLLRHAGQTVRLHIGEPVPARELQRIPPLAQTAYLRLLTESLGAQAALPIQIQQAPLALPQAPARLAAELAALPPECLLCAQGDFEVYRCEAAMIPQVLAEIGRLRELSFRLVHEGSGKARDLDQYDAQYQHLFVWHRGQRELIGAYRLGFTAAIVATSGVAGLYTHSLFDYDARLLERIGPALELGRSFVSPHWQRNFRPLRLLWSGIAIVLDQHPELRCLFGPVSISASYSRTGRALMEAALSEHHCDPELRALVRPRTPAPKTATGAATDAAARSVVSALAEPSLLSQVIARVERGSGLPVLLRHYLELHGRFAGFNVDDSFGGTLDGLVFVRVDEIPARVRAKFGAPARMTAV